MVLEPLTWLRDLDRRTRPIDPATERVHRERWQELPEHVRTPGQLLGRKLTGCEGTHGVFPACDFGCEPCYHGTDANRVPVDGGHTVAEVRRQMAYLEARRGRGQFAQLIGGEVTLLDPADHARALQVMQDHGRRPMSFTHGDIDLDHLEAIVLDAHGDPRFDHVSFAVHVDSTMRGRRGIKRPTSEAQLHGERARIAQMFSALRERHGVTCYLAHNMTVTPENLAEVADVVGVCRELGYRMNSFQPAAYVGDQRRWDDGYRQLDDDAVWGEVEAGVGRSLPYGGLQVGDLRCNRTTWGAWAGDTYVPVLEDDDPHDLAGRDAFLRALPASLLDDPDWVRVVRVVRSLTAHPRDVPTLLAWGSRLLARGLPGLVASLTDRSPGRRIQPVTYVMHRFMDAADVAAAWDLMEQGEEADDPTLRATQERLRACAYGMAHPEDDRIVPACVQHSVLDQQENQVLLELLPTRRADSS